MPLNMVESISDETPHDGKLQYYSDLGVVNVSNSWLMAQMLL